MNKKTLFLAWQDQGRNRAWYPVGRLDVMPDHFRFRYIGGAERARKSARFEPMVDFPDLHGNYESPKLFALFQNRVLLPGRSDFHEYVKMLDLPDSAEPVEILEVGGGRRATDSFEVFPKIEKGPDGAFRCRFFLHGWRHVNSAAQERLNSLKAGEKLYVSIELTNPATQFAVQIQTLDYHMIGWAPRYLVTDLVAAIAQKIGHYEANVVRVNPMPAPSKQRVLIEFRGDWPGYEPMSGQDFEPLAK
jgi:HIRAN domain